MARDPAALIGSQLTQAWGGQLPQSAFVTVTVRLHMVEHLKDTSSLVKHAWVVNGAEWKVKAARTRCRGNHFGFGTSLLSASLRSLLAIRQSRVSEQASLPEANQP